MVQLTFAALLCSLAVIAVSAQGPEVCLSIDYTIFPAVNNYDVCSTQGACENDGSGFKCKCNAGWTGRSDLMNTEGVDCQVNEIAIVVLWGVNLISTIYSAYVSYPNVNYRYGLYAKRREEMRGRGRRLPIYKQHALLGSLGLMYFGFPVMLVAAVLRMAKWDERVGVTIGMTFMFFIVKFAFYTSNYLYATSLLSSLLSGAKFKRARIKQLIRINTIAYRVLTTLSISAGATGFISYGIEGNLGVGEKAAYTLYFVMMVISMICYASLFHYIQLNVLRVLDESIAITDSEQTKKLRGRLVKVTSSGRTQAALQLFIYGIFLFWPVLWNKHDYFLPVSWLAFNKIGREVCLSTIKDTSGSKSGSKGGSKGSKSGEGFAEEFEYTSNRELGPATTFADKSEEEYI